MFSFPFLAIIIFSLCYEKWACARWATFSINITICISKQTYNPPNTQKEKERAIFLCLKLWSLTKICSRSIIYEISTIISTYHLWGNLLQAELLLRFHPIFFLYNKVKYVQEHSSTSDFLLQLSPKGHYSHQCTC